MDKKSQEMKSHEKKSQFKFANLAVIQKLWFRKRKSQEKSHKGSTFIIHS